MFPVFDAPVSTRLLAPGQLPSTSFESLVNNVVYRTSCSFTAPPTTVTVQQFFGVRSPRDIYFDVFASDQTLCSAIPADLEVQMATDVNASPVAPRSSSTSPPTFDAVPYAAAFRRTRQSVRRVLGRGWQPGRSARPPNVLRKFCGSWSASRVRYVQL